MIILMYFKAVYLNVQIDLEYFYMKRNLRSYKGLKSMDKIELYIERTRALMIKFNRLVDKVS